jgi:hypothetical protein
MCDGRQAKLAIPLELGQWQAALRHSHKPSLATVFDYSCALAQGDWCPRPALTCGEVCRFRDLKVLDTSQVLYNVLAVGIPHVDAVSETGAIVYRHFSLLQSSSASRFTAAHAGFFDLSQSGERPERYGESFRFDTMLKAHYP